MVASARDEVDRMAASALDRCRDAGLYLAAAESLTGGLLADAFVRIPGASDVFLGSAVTYDIAAKASILGVDADLLSSQGAVHPKVAEQMAIGAARLYTQRGHEGRVIGLSTTGVAGPGPDGADPAGLVYIGIALPEGMALGDDSGPTRLEGYRARSLELHLQGGREDVRRGTVAQILERLGLALA